MWHAMSTLVVYVVRLGPWMNHLTRFRDTWTIWEFRDLCDFGTSLGAWDAIYLKLNGQASNEQFEHIRPLLRELPIYIYILGRIWLSYITLGSLGLLTILHPTSHPHRTCFNISFTPDRVNNP